MPSPIGASRPVSEPSLGPARDAAPPAAAVPAEPDYQRVFDANPRLPDLRHLLEPRLQGKDPAVIEPLALHPSSDPVLAKLDDVERRFAGPYRVEGRDQPIVARAVFHSANALNGQLKEDRALLAQARHACQGKVLSAALNACMAARPSAQQLVQVTQALIDAGQLKGISPIGSAEIRALQQRFCIGIDCIGYVSETQRALHGPQFDRGAAETFFVDHLRKSGVYDEQPGHLRSVASARPGDVMHLDRAPTTENREHNVVVRQRDAISRTDPRWGSLAAGGAKLMAGGGPVHLLDVVQSGGGPDDVRGIRHQTWLYDERSGAWGVVDPATKQIELFVKGPQEHPSGGLFTPRKAW